MINIYMAPYSTLKCNCFSFSLTSSFVIRLTSPFNDEIFLYNGCVLLLVGDKVLSAVAIFHIITINKNND